MIYRQTANPNATNSELDAKVIVKHSPKSDYEKFQEWLNDCPVEIVNYLDYSDRFEVTFMVNLEEEKWYKLWENIPQKCIMKSF